MRTLASARELLAERVDSLASVEISLATASGCRLADSLCADMDLPAADVSMMDGYAARAGDLAAGAPMPVAFEVPAGRGPQSLPAGAAARIFTGAVIPDGADMVVPQEQAEVDADGTVRLATLKAGSFIRFRGELCAAGTVLADAGEMITPQLIVLLGTVGAGTVRVTPKPRVAVLSTGSELVPVEVRPEPGKIRDSNGMMLAALVRAAGFELASVARVTDEVDALCTEFTRAAAEADLIVSCGGVSVGDYDLVPKALGDLGAQTLFHRLSIKPGKPVLTARMGKTWVVGLPGNPISSLVGWRMFARPLGRRLAGDVHAFEETPESGVLTGPIHNTGDRTFLAPARLTPGHPVAEVTVLPPKGSHDVVTIAHANALALVEVGARLAEGDTVRCYRLD